MDKNSTVWVTQEMPKFNYTSAEKYGDVKFIATSDFSPMVNSLHNGQLAKSITAALADFDFDRDYIAPTGSPIVTMAVMAVLGRRGRKFRVLKWDNRGLTYIPMFIEV